MNFIYGKIPKKAMSTYSQRNDIQLFMRHYLLQQDACKTINIANIFAFIAKLIQDLLAFIIYALLAIAHSVLNIH